MSIYNSVTKDELLDAACTAFVSHTVRSSEEIRPKLVHNNISKGITFLSNLLTNLNNCTSFWFTVAFITESGLAPLKLKLKELADKNIKGKILTSNYLYFNKPKIYAELLRIPNLEIRVSTTDLHIKGYYFEHQRHSNLIIGSSNLTDKALKTNNEWSLQVSSLSEGALINEVNRNFIELWDQADKLTTAWIEEYTPSYEAYKATTTTASVVPIKIATIKPNKMQREAVEQIKQLYYQNNTHRGLLISATGTGKTYISAFSTRELSPKRILFLAHREQLLEQAKASFYNVLGNSHSMGILSGNHDNKSADYIFATVQTLSKQSTLSSFSPTDFELIIIDEAHHATASSYQTIINYFKPNFILGMTATPERTDSASDIYALFEHNIAYEIRLQQAMEYDLLSPFHYYGISDLIVDGRSIEDTTAFNDLLLEDRVKHILDNIKYLGHSGEQVKGLVFCRSVEESQALAERFTSHGHPAFALSGKDSIEKRQRIISQLEETNNLEYIFTCDIFNEGVDIPMINQVIMLRPTQSPIVFIQQLGRGLRKYHHKDYVTIIDFIGNYNTNFMIPIALSGDTSYNKDNLRRYVAEDYHFIPGVSTINFDSITKQQIYQSIDTSPIYNSIKLIKENYLDLKRKLGKIPSILDFNKLGSMDPSKFFANKNLNHQAPSTSSYYGFLVKYEPEYNGQLTLTEEHLLAYFSMFLSSGKRQEELLILQQLLDKDTIVVHGPKLLLENIIKQLTNDFHSNSAQKKTFTHAIFIKADFSPVDSAIDLNFNYVGIRDTMITYQLQRSDNFTTALSNAEFQRHFQDVLNYAFINYHKYYSTPYKGLELSLYRKYTYGEVCSLLNWHKNETATIGGYKHCRITNTFPIFINYSKEDTLKESIQYNDRLLSNDTLIAYSKSKRTLDSPEIKTLRNATDKDLKILLFIRKYSNDKESKEFYFLGTMYPTNEFTPVTMPSGDNAIEITYKLSTPIKNSLYDYLTID